MGLISFELVHTRQPDVVGRVSGQDHQGHVHEAGPAGRHVPEPAQRGPHLRAQQRHPHHVDAKYAGEEGIFLDTLFFFNSF